MGIVLSRRALGLASLLGTIIPLRTLAASRVSIGLQCVTNTNGEKPERHFAITFDLKNDRWSVAEPGSTSDVFKSKNGTFVTVVNVTSLKTNSGEVAGVLTGFDPMTAKDKEHRNDGLALQTGRTFDWTVSIIVA